MGRLPKLSFSLLTAPVKSQDRTSISTQHLRALGAVSRVMPGHLLVRMKGSLVLETVSHLFTSLYGILVPLLSTLLDSHWLT